MAKTPTTDISSFRRRSWLWLLALVTGLWLMLPTYVILPMSLNATDRLAIWPSERSWRLYGRLFEDPQWYEALLRSLRVGLIVAVLATLIGTLAAFALARGFSRASVAVITAVVMSPIIIPGVLAAIGQYSVFLEWRLVGTETALVLAHTCIGVPLVVVSVMASLRAVDPRLESAAQSLGAHPASAVWHVTLPLIRPGLVVGAFLAFMFSFDEVIVSLFLTGPTSRTLPVKMFSALRDDIDPTVAAASALVLVFTTAAVLLIGVNRLSRNSTEGTA